MAKHKKHHDHWRRSVVKTLSYRLVIIIVVYLTSYLITHKHNEALAITAWNTATATVIYYIHERVWSRIKWGRN